MIICLITSWLQYVADFRKKNPTIADGSIPILMSQYGDGTVSKILLAGKKISSTASIADKLHQEQLQHWLDTAKPPRTVFKYLLLDQAGENLFESPPFATWLSYVDHMRSKNPRTQRIAVMTSYYGDEALTKMILEAMKVPGTANIAAKLHEDQIRRWLNTQTSAEDVYKFLALDKAGDKLFANPQLTTWVKYVDNLNKENPEKKTTLMSVLTRYYDSEGLIRMLESAKNVPGSAALTWRLEAEQKWLTKGTPDDFFKRLKLDKVENGVLESPQLSVWINHMKEYNAANPKYQATSIGTLAGNYGDVKLIKILDEAAKVKETARISKKLQGELSQRCIQKGWTPEYIFDKVLHLDQEGDKLFMNPLVITWGGNI